MAIPGLIELRVPQAKITAQVNDALTQTLKIRDTLLRHAVWQGQKEHITRFQLCDADEFEACLLAQIGMHVMQKFPLLALRGDLGQFDCRMLEQQAHQLPPDIA
jgi:hypothetical protein